MVERAFKIEKVYLKDRVLFQVLEIFILSQVEVYLQSEIGYRTIATYDTYEEAEKTIKEILKEKK
jgi:hypothetical protein